MESGSNRGSTEGVDVPLDCWSKTKEPGVLTKNLRGIRLICKSFWRAG